MPQILNQPSELTALAYKDYVSVVSRPFIGSTFGETLSLIIRKAVSFKIDFASLMNKLSGSTFAEQLVAKSYGDIRRTIPKIEKTIIPSVFFDFIDSAIANTGADFSDDERVIIKMLHLSIFKSWNAVLDQDPPATLVNYDQLTPARNDLINDMIRVYRSKEISRMEIKPLPSERVSAPIIVDSLMTIYASILTNIVSADNISRKVDAILGAIVLWINDSLEHTSIATSPNFVALTRNITLVKMAQKQFTLANVPKTVVNDAYFIDLAIKDFQEYLRDDSADLRAYRVQDLAATHHVNRYMNHKSKTVKAVLIAPNYDDLKLIQWFHKRISIGSSYVKLLTSTDPTGVITGVTAALDHKFFASELTKVMGDLAQHTIGDGVTTRVIKAPKGDDFLTYLALTRSEQAKLVGSDLEFVYKMDESITIESHLISAGRTDVGALARSKSAFAVCTFSGKQPQDAIPFPLRVQTVEKYADTNLLPKGFITGHAINQPVKMRDSYMVNDKEVVNQKPVSLADIIFTGVPMDLMFVAYSDIFSDVISELVKALNSCLLLAPSMSYMRVRAANNIWLAIKGFEKSTDFGYHSSSFRNFLDIPIDPSKPADAARNFVQSNLAMARMMLHIGTGADLGAVSDLLQTVFSGKLDAISLITEAEIARISS
jgi:flavin reductase (DIM6/NTAB) family NADH-FMN oxidoreductase RutF